MFTNTFAKLNQQAVSLSNDIQSLEQQLEQKRQQLSEIQNYLQAFRSATSACEAAIEQTHKALQMLKAVAPDNISEFQGELNSLFNNPVLDEANIEEEQEEEEEKVPTEEPSIEEPSAPPNEEKASTTTIDVTADIEKDEPSPELPEDAPDNAPDDFLSYKDLLNIEYESLKAIAISKGIEINGSKTKLASKLKGKISAKDLINLT